MIFRQLNRAPDHLCRAPEPEWQRGRGRHLHPRVLRQQVHPLLRLAAQGLDRRPNRIEDQVLGIFRVLRDF